MNVRIAIKPEVCSMEMATSYLVSLICGIRNREFTPDLTEDMKTPSAAVIGMLPWRTLYSKSDRNSKTSGGLVQWKFGKVLWWVPSAVETTVTFWS
jgi:hypothetical protein